jgi:hypothetical protein
MEERIDRRAARPTTATDLHRLADQGRANGVLILTECITGARYATSATQPGIIYFVTGFSCTCPGFVGHQRCQHHSLLLERFGWLPDAEDETEPVPVAPPAPVPVITVDPDRQDEVARRRAVAEDSRQRMAARALDPGAADRALAECSAARVARVAAGVTVARV